MKPNRNLTEKEATILIAICDQKSSKEIGVMMGLASRSIETYRAKLLVKTGCLNTAGLVVFAIKHGIYKIPGAEKSQNLGLK